MKTADDILKEKGTDLICVDENATIADALSVMIENKIGSILVKREGKIVGIWTERDLLRNTLENGFDHKTAIVKDYMSTDLISASAQDSVYLLMDKFLGLRLRHLLICHEEDSYTGMLSTGDIIKAALNEKSTELKELNKILSWEYYENWMWKK